LAEINEGGRFTASKLDKAKVSLRSYCCTNDLC
jgi:hypothetical protein